MKGCLAELPDGLLHLEVNIHLEAKLQVANINGVARTAPHKSMCCHITGTCSSNTTQHSLHCRCFRYWECFDTMLQFLKRLQNSLLKTVLMAKKCAVLTNLMTQSSAQSAGGAHIASAGTPWSGSARLAAMALCRSSSSSWPCPALAVPPSSGHFSHSPAELLPCLPDPLGFGLIMLPPCIAPFADVTVQSLACKAFVALCEDI